MWVNRNKLNNSLVVLIHGLFGNPWTSWQGVPVRLQSAFSSERFLRSYDMYLFQYETKWRRQPALHPDVCATLHRFIEDQDDKYDTIVLIAHSQGGVLAKLYVLDCLARGDGLTLRIDLIIALGTPHRGALPAVLSLAIPGLRQAHELVPCSRNVRRLRREWGAPLISPEPIAPTTHSRYIKSVTVIGAYDKLVGKRSARGFDVDTPDYWAASHPALAKEGIATDVVTRELNRHRRPAAILEEIREIKSDVATHDNYVRRYANMVARVVKVAQPGLSPQSLEDRTVALLEDFLIDFPERPLRGLIFGDALAKYTVRRLGPEV